MGSSGRFATGVRSYERSGGALVGLVALVWASSTFAQAPAGRGVFTQPLVVEHQLIQTEGGQEVLRTTPVTDYYGGSWIVSVRPDRSRLVVDFARSELVEIRLDQGTYCVLSFDRFAELKRRLARAEGPLVETPPTRSEDVPATSSSKPAPRVAVEELAPSEGATRDASVAAAGPHRREGVTRVRVRVESEAPAEQATPTMDIWLDGQVRLSTAATQALGRFERDVIGVGIDGAGVPPARLVSAAREWGEGRFVVRTEREAGPGVRVCDEVSKLEVLPAFPVELLQVPDGFRQVSHPLEAMVAHAEREAELSRAMSRSQAK